MQSEVGTLAAELRRIQSENIALYDKLANLKRKKSELQQSNDEDDTSSNDFKAQIEDILAKQKKERSNRKSAQKSLQALIIELKQIQNEIDNQKSIIQNHLMPVMTAEEEMTNQFYKDVLVKCKGKPPSPDVDYNKIEDLISQISKKSREYIESQDEIEKYSRLIVINENPIPQSSKINSYFQFNHPCSIGYGTKGRRKNYFKFNYI